MAERPEDLNLPVAVINRLVKEKLPDGVNVSKEARAAISKAASVFVLFATSCANNFALKAKRKTLLGTDVLSAMGDMDFDQFLEPLQESLDVYRRDQKGRKDALERRKKLGTDAELETPETEDVDDEGLEAGDEAAADEDDDDGAGSGGAVDGSSASSDDGEDDDNMDAESV